MARVTIYVPDEAVLEVGDALTKREEGASGPKDIKDHLIAYIRGEVRKHREKPVRGGADTVSLDIT